MTKIDPTAKQGVQNRSPPMAASMDLRNLSFPRFWQVDSNVSIWLGSGRGNWVDVRHNISAMEEELCRDSRSI